MKPAPEDWAFSDAVETVQLETRPEDPYSVNVWGVAAGGRFYIAAGKSDNAWAKHIAADPNVRLKIADDVFELRATRTLDPREHEIFFAAAKQKYDFEPDEKQRDRAVLFRLEPR